MKGYDTEPAIEALRPVVGPATAVLTLQNGVDSPDQLAAAFGVERVLAGTTTINVAVVEPGVVLDRGVPIRTTIAELSGQLTPRLESIAAAFRPIGAEVVMSRDAKVALWQKFVLLAPHGTITAATGLPVGKVRETPTGAALYRQLVHEAVAVGRADGAALPAEIADATIDFIMTRAPADGAQLPGARLRAPQARRVGADHRRDRAPKSATRRPDARFRPTLCRPEGAGARLRWH